MAKLNYIDEANRLAKATDFAIEAMEKFPPKDWEEKHIKHFVTVYNEFKETTLNPKPQYKNMASLKYKINDVFTYFQEGSGEAVNYFWEQVNKTQLGYKRENKLNKILKRGKIKDQIEYDYIIDTIGPYQQGGIIQDQEVNLLNGMLSTFEKKSGIKD